MELKNASTTDNKYDPNKAKAASQISGITTPAPSRPSVSGAQAIGDVSPVDTTTLVRPDMPDVRPTGKTDRQKMAESMAASQVANVGGKPADYKTAYQKTGESMAKEGYSNVGDLYAGPNPVEKEAPQGVDPKAKSAADSATEIANAKPDQVAATLDKLAEEEKKGGPNFFDILEAAAAGWNGKVPLYVQKEIKAKEHRDDLEALQKQSSLASTRQKEEAASRLEEEKTLQKDQQDFQSQLAQKEADLRLQLAGLKAPGAANPKGLSLSGLSSFGGK